MKKRLLRWISVICNDLFFAPLDNLSLHNWILPKMAFMYHSFSANFLYFNDAKRLDSKLLYIECWYITPCFMTKNFGFG